MMDQGKEDGEFWLPPDFLTDDFFLEEEEKRNLGVRKGDERAFFIPESATETESDEDDYIAGLTRQMAHSFLLDDENESPKTYKVMGTSPQSTLCGAGSWSFSSKGSPEGPSLVSSPPSTPLQKPKDDALELLYAAAGQVVRIGLDDERAPQHNVLPRKPACSFSPPVFTQQQLQAAQFYQLKQQQLMKQQQQFASAWGRQNRSRGSGNGGYGEGRVVRPLGLSSSAWPPLQKQQQQHTQPGSGMRAVFLNGSGVRRESAGTGVFLPRRIGSPNEPRKKPGCSTVLLPARVVQALNLNLDDMGVHHPCHHPVGYFLDQDALVARSSPALAHPKRSPVSPQRAAATNYEVRLPPEWTY